MEHATSDLELNTNNSKLLVYLLRSALNSDKYKHLKERWRFRQLKNQVLCIRREVIGSVTATNRNVNDSPLDQLQIIQLLIEQNPHDITFTNIKHLTQSDVKKLFKFAESYSYTLSLDDIEHSITFLQQSSNTGASSNNADNSTDDDPPAEDDDTDFSFGYARKP